MKKEQIEQAAKGYAVENCKYTFVKCETCPWRGESYCKKDARISAFLAGAESRQAEIDELSTKLEHATKWTSCSIRMPEGVGRVLVKFTVDDNDDEIICEAMHDVSGFYGYYVEDLMCDDRDVNFIAWLPYPY